ncbi:MAG TPA: enoyl-CoA hydratase-related protein [Steroidobacteraceae bacterium]|nr:enoyl-CoA hydratase-related protein [Steroidobacteraceae bacterium]
MSDQILVSQSDGVCEVRLNRPEKRNAITLAMYDALSHALMQAEADESVQVILISGAGAGFTAGNDILDFLNSAALDPEHGAPRFLRLLPKLRKIVVAAIHGSTVGIGVTMLLHCDLVIAARSARLSMPFVRLGLVPEAASSLLLPRLVGHQRAAELLLLGSVMDADTACRLGLVNRVTEEGTQLDEARAMARAVAQLPAGALRATKELLRAESSSAEVRIEEELQAFAARLASEEFKAAAQAFLAKSRPG